MANSIEEQSQRYLLVYWNIQIAYFSVCNICADRNVLKTNLQCPSWSGNISHVADHFWQHCSGFGEISISLKTSDHFLDLNCWCLSSHGHLDFFYFFCSTFDQHVSDKCEATTLWPWGKKWCLFLFSQVSGCWILLAATQSLPMDWQWQGYEIATIFEICTAAGMVLNHSSEGDHSLVSVILLLFG